MFVLSFFFLGFIQVFIVQRPSRLETTFKRTLKLYINRTKRFQEKPLNQNDRKSVKKSFLLSCLLRGAQFDFFLGEMRPYYAVSENSHLIRSDEILSVVTPCEGNFIKIRKTLTDRLGELFSVCWGTSRDWHKTGPAYTKLR